MPRPRKPARLYFRKDEQQWVIRDENIQRRTGYGLGQRSEAETALQEYLAARRAPPRSGPAHPAELTVGEVLARYADDKGTAVQSVDTLAYSIGSLAPFWGKLTCDAVKGSTCRLYEREHAKPRQSMIVTASGQAITRTRRAGSSTVRRELAFFKPHSIMPIVRGC